MVVYDNAGGFLTGGGWITSGGGKANFGLNAKYQKSSSTPTGNTSFDAHAANIVFSSTSYEWLVIASAKSQK